MAGDRSLINARKAGETACPTSKSPVGQCAFNSCAKAVAPAFFGTRRRCLSAGLVGLSLKAERQIAGSFVNESHLAAHRLRDHAAMKSPSRVVRVPVVIAGGGMSGLSAAWRFQKKH